MLRSQIVREKGPEVDPLWIGKGCMPEDLAKPQIMIESTAGDAHPGSTHLQALSNAAKNGVYAAGCMPSQYTVSDICDGVATGHEGMNYSLISRNLIAGMTEIHAMASGYDGLVGIASCDKAVPGLLMAIARLNIPAVFVPGGSMIPGPNFISADTCYETDMSVACGEMTVKEENYYQYNACLSCGACIYMGTACTMQCMSEALGIALPGSAVAPANTNIVLTNASNAAKRVADMIRTDLRPRDILTKDAFMNAIKIHAAIGGSLNAILHLPSIAEEAGITLTLEDFKKGAEGIPLLTRLLTNGKWPVQYFWFAGGIPRIMLELKDHLNLDLMTVTGKTIRENLEELEASGYFRRCEEMLANYNLTVRDIIHSVDDPADTDTGVSVLYGNISEEGSVVKHYAMVKSLYHFEGRAVVFEDEESAEDAIYKGEIKPGDAVIIRYVGVKAKGMPEMLKATNAICNRPELVSSTMLITDGRFSGATQGPAIGYLHPEASEGGNIALIENDDLIELDIYSGSLNLVGVKGERKSPAEIDEILAERRKHLVIKTFKREGVLKYI